MTILSTVLVLGVLIFVHELGHFIFAKRAGIRVEKFSLGFPPHIFSKQVGETTYCIGVIPLGGYVKMLGENPDEEGQGDGKEKDKAEVTNFDSAEFMSKTVGQRASVVFAGPFMNYILAILLMIGIFTFSGSPNVDRTRIVIGQVTEDSPAEKAGIKPGDQIIAFDNVPVNAFDSLASRINSRVAKPLTLTFLRGTDTLSTTLTTRVETLPNLDGGVDSIGVIGIQQEILSYTRMSFPEAIKQGFVTTHVIVWETAKFLKNLVTLKVSPRLIGGPIFIAKQSGREARKGVSNLLFFMALLSVNLAVLNVLPIPILDGGQLLFLLCEKIRGIPLSRRVRGIAQQVGIIFMLGMVLLVAYNDILREIRGY